VSFAVVAWYWTGGGAFWLFAVALALPIMVDLAFMQSDARAERERKARLGAGA